MTGPSGPWTSTALNETPNQCCHHVLSFVDDHVAVDAVALALLVSKVLDHR